MATASPIFTCVIEVDRKAVDELAQTKAAIDRGCSLSKILYLDRDCKQHDVFYTFHCAVFKNADFEGALRFLKQKALLPATGKLRVTGTGCQMYEDLIEQVIGLETEFISEMVTIYRGYHFLLTHAMSPGSLFYPDIELKDERSQDMIERIQMFKKMLSANNSETEGDIFPSLYVLCGSATGGFLMHADGRCNFLGFTIISGKTLLALGQALVGTSDYDELMDLAAAGDYANLDTTFGEYFKTDPTSAYGGLPGHLPLFAFGKMADSAKPLEEYSRPDRAAAVVRLMAEIIMTDIRGYCQQASVSNVIIGGHMFASEVMRRSLLSQTNPWLSGLLNIRFLSTGHSGAFGAMVAAPSDSKYMS